MIIKSENEITATVTAVHLPGGNTIVMREPLLEE